MGWVCPSDMWPYGELTLDSPPGEKLFSDNQLTCHHEGQYLALCDPQQH